MSLSFQDSLKAAQAEERQPVMPVMPVIEEHSVMTLDATPAINEEILMTAAYSGEDGSWNQHPNYKYYNDYSDDAISTIDTEKNISLNSKQFNITQEENSQFIPFEISRYYDGFDLTTTTISIHYETSDGYHDEGKIVNVTYNNEKIRFAWLVDGKVTHVAGKVKFVVRAIGTNSNGEPYVWKSKDYGELNVSESFCIDCDNVITLDDSWVQELVTSVAENVAEKIAEAQVKDEVTAAQLAAASAQEYASLAETHANNAESVARVTAENIILEGNYATETYVDDAISAVDVSSQLENYVTKDQLEQEISNVDVTEQLKDYALAEDLSALSMNLTTNYDTKENVDLKIAAKLDGYATESYVDTALSNADLDSYYKKNETYNQSEIDEKLKNVAVDLTGYATESYVDNKANILSGSINTNSEDISTLSKTVGDLQSDVNSIDKSPRLTYDVVYNDAEDEDVGENVFVFYEIENEGKENEVREAKKKFTIVGGSGGGITSSSLKIGYITTSPLVVTVDDAAIIKYTFSGTDSSGDVVPEGTATWKVGGRIVATTTALNGENSFDVTE